MESRVLRTAAAVGLILLPDTNVPGVARIEGRVLRYDVSVDRKRLTAAVLEAIAAYAAVVGSKAVLAVFLLLEWG
jgi:hypothetical protein